MADGPPRLSPTIFPPTDHLSFRFQQAFQLFFFKIGSRAFLSILPYSKKVF